MTDPDRFELFSYWRTSATYRVRVAFRLKGVEPRETDVDIDAGAHLEPAFLAINPMGAIPALIDRGEGQTSAPMTQSLAILEFLDETYPSPPLLPADAHGRARVRSLCQLLAADTHPLVTPRVKRYLSTTGGFDADAWRAWQIQWFGAGLRALEQRLAGERGTGRFCHGNTPTLADICLASIVVVMRVFRIEIDGIPTVRRIMAECERLDAFRLSAPALQDGAPPQPASVSESFAAFEARALADGADAVLERHWAPNQFVQDHAHPFEADALVAAGEMWLIDAKGAERHLKPGDTFHLPPGTPHSERYGPKGATYWVARRNPR
jgi:maleylacetoacetate isomerase